MIKKLKMKFVLLSMTALFIILSIAIVGMNLINYNSVVKEADEILALLSQNKGRFPDMGGNKEKKLPHHMSPEIPYESRYFSVLFNEFGDVIQTHTGYITSVDSTKAITYAKKAMNQGESKGFVGDFRYERYYDGDAIRITFLDCGRKLDSFREFLIASLGMGIAGLVILFLVIFFCAGRIIRPIAESYEKQKRFITDAGHEIKTPLTIIHANADVLEMEIGQNECLTDIQQQTKRLTELTNDLVYLARMEEAENSLQMIDFPVSEVVQDAAHSFKAPAQTQEKEFICDIQMMLSMCGNDKAIEQLVSILIDNALKYTPKGGKISLHFHQKSKKLYLTVCNTTETVLQQKNLDSVFDRFYRTDASRNSETGGHGIGLSIAKAIVTAHNGKISASAKDEQTFEIMVVLPV